MSFGGVLLSPELFFARIFHRALTLRTGSHVPDTDTIATTLQTEAPHLTPIRRSHISNDTTHDDILDGLTIGTCHSCDLLTEQTTALIDFGLVTASLTAIFPFPSHMTSINQAPDHNG